MVFSLMETLAPCKCFRGYSPVKMPIQGMYGHGRGSYGQVRAAYGHGFAHTGPVQAAPYGLARTSPVRAALYPARTEPCTYQPRTELLFFFS